MYPRFYSVPILCYSLFRRPSALLILYFTYPYFIYSLFRFTMYFTDPIFWLPLIFYFILYFIYYLFYLPSVLFQSLFHFYSQLKPPSILFITYQMRSPIFIYALFYLPSIFILFSILFTIYAIFSLFYFTIYFIYSPFCLLHIFCDLFYLPSILATLYVYPIL